MGKLTRLELFNFKSYKGHHVLLFGDSYFTSIIGPNGSGKSNSMDAISFVLGIKSSHLRSTHLRDLVYRGRILKSQQVAADGSAGAANADTSNGAANGHTNGDAHSGDEAPQASASQRNDPQNAWVMAVYEDDAGDVQRWKRSITSSGQSEYRINNRVVSSKQYNDALESENILIKARNFLVFQGDVEAIASQSPKDLTRLVEQISGSLEHKPEYDRLQEESEQALENQNFKLNQRRVLNAEIKQYREQKKEADNYNEKAEQRDNAIVKHVLWKLYHFQRVIEESGAEIQKHQDELKEHRRHVQKYEQQLDEARQAQAKAGREVNKTERQIKTREKDTENKRNDLVPIDEKISMTEKSIEKHKKRIADVTKERDSQANVVDQLKKDLGTVGKARSKWEEEHKKAMKNSGKQLSASDLHEYNNLRAEANKNSAAVQSQIDTYSRQFITDQEAVNSLATKVDEHSKLLKRLDSEIDDISQKRDDINSTVEETKKEITNRKQKLNLLSSERVRATQNHNELEEKLQAVLRQLVEADDGRRQSEREIRAKETVTAMKRLFPGVRGRISELCKPKQEKYKVAVSTVLGRNFDSVVVDTEKTAKDCIAYLRDQRAGQATFIPLDSIQFKPVNTNFKEKEKRMRFAIDTIDFDNSIERAMSYACGNAMVCDDLATAKDLCFNKNVKAKAVTLDGTVIHKGGLMTGGRGPNDQNTRKWEDAAVEKLRKQRDNFLSQIAALPKASKNTAEEEVQQFELSGLESRLNYAQEELKSLKMNLDGKTKQKKYTEKQLKETQPKWNQSVDALKALQGRIDGCKKELSLIEDKIFAQFCKRLQYTNIREYEAQQGSLQQEENQKKLEFSLQTSKLESQLSFETQRLQSTKDRIKALEAQSGKDKKLMDTLRSEKGQLEEELEQIEEEFAELQAAVEEQRAIHESKIEDVSEKKRELQKRSKDIDLVQKTITGLEAEMQRKAAGRYALLRKCKIEETHLPLTDDSAPLDSLPVDNSLQQDPDAMDVDQGDATFTETPDIQDYGIELDFDSLDDDDMSDESETKETALQADIDSLNSELATLNPNMRAIERLTTAESRRDVLDEEYRVARDAANEAREAFEDVRDRRADLFNSAFNHITEQIGPVYKALTRSAQFPMGGQAYLDTMAADDDSPFLEGLKYHAMPPLKRFRDMDALSGGEKTIAALALLFAVHSYAPSPFFVLDEVDAALDVANVAKVAKYIREHAAPGMQFIVISLKTGLFQESECLVGIHRDQGANTSRTVTLDLRKYQPN